MGVEAEQQTSGGGASRSFEGNMIAGQWYVAACLRELKRREPLELKICGGELEISRRRGGGVTAFCPRQGHELPCRVSEDLVWVYVGKNCEFETPGVDVPVFGGPKGRVRFMEKVVIPAPQDDAIYGLLDPAHTPFVHRSPIWRGNGKLKHKRKRFEPSDFGFTMVPHAPVNSDIYKLIGGAVRVRIAFRLPGLRAEYIQNSKHTVLGLTALTPMDDGATVLRQIFYWDTPVLAAIRPIAGPISRGFLQQDVDIMALRAKNAGFGGKGMLVGDSDRQFLWYLQLKKAWHAALEAGETFRNPLEPATLQWRT
jgi:hypothetical protein